MSVNRSLPFTEQVDKPFSLFRVCLSVWESSQESVRLLPCKKNFSECVHWYSAAVVVVVYFILGPVIPF